jgi:predicted methyltransferase
MPIVMPRSCSIHSHRWEFQSKLEAMKNTRTLTRTCSTAGLAAACALAILFAAQAIATGDEAANTAALQAAIDNSARPAAERARDRYRHPLQTLQFFGIKPDMTVVEIWPGAGWYTDILAPYLKEHGKLYEAVPPGHNADAYRKKIAADPNLYGKVIFTELGPPDHYDIAPPHSVDMVLTFRNVHNWMRGGYAEDVFKAMYKALRPAGILGVEEHRGNPKLPQDPKAATGYVRQDYVIALAEKAGFHLMSKSEINANPKDTKDYPKGVWTLPPTLRLGNTDRAKYLAIGESDRMTLKFVKPIHLASMPH